MQNAAAGADDGFGTIVSDLISLIKHVQASISLIDGAIARETSRGDADAANVIVLDDITPQYLKAGRALQASRCKPGDRAEIPARSTGIGVSADPARSRLRQFVVTSRASSSASQKENI